MFALKDLEIFFKTLNLSGENQITILLIGCIILLGWGMYSRSLAETEKKLDRVRVSYENIYSPAYGMIISYRSGLLTDDEFNEKFRDLLIEHRSKSKDTKLIHEMNNWLCNKGDIGWIQALLEDQCKRCEKKIVEGVEDFGVLTIAWGIRTAGFVSFIGFTMAVVLFCTVTLLKVLSSSNLSWAFVLVVAVILVAALIITEKRRTRRLKRRKREIDQQYSSFGSK